MLPKPRAILFDWDGTLVDTLPLINAGHNHLLAQHGLPPIDMGASKNLTAYDPQTIITSLIGSQDEAMIKEGLDNFRRFVREHHLQHLSLMDGAGELIQAAASHAIPMGIVTNKSKDLLQAELTQLNWQQLFIAIVGPNEAARNKPNPDPAYHALDLMQLPPGTDIWLVGDTHGDIACGINAGLSAILIHDGDYLDQPQPSLQLPDCRALLELLKTYFN